MLNKVILMGRLTQEPELRVTASGVNVCSFSLAVQRDFARPGEEKQTDFINISAFRNTAEFVSKWFHKGQLVAVCGRLQTRSWDDPNGGGKRYATDVVADEVHFAEPKRDNYAGQGYAPQGGGYPQQQYGAAQQFGAAQQQQPQYNAAPPAGFNVDMDSDEDLPF